jgi:proton-dependent oligopeptide transporter, POT family
VGRLVTPTGATELTFCNIVALSTDPLLVWNYGTMAVLSGLGGVLFWFSFRRLDAEDASLDNLGEGHFES